ncbi:MAG: GNAT family N-acetyltransferase [bacterium]|nr:GNAT family N-acetyltransferase [bacterium]
MTQDELKLTLTEQPTAEDRDIVSAGLVAFNQQHAPPDEYRPLDVYLRDASGEIIGGLIGETYWGWLHIDILWLRDDVRGLGYGKRMLEMAEAQARQRGCKRAHLDTLSFQALDFYQKLGWTVWGQLDDLPEGHTRYFLKKSLV